MRFRRWLFSGMLGLVFCRRSVAFRPTIHVVACRRLLQRRPLTTEGNSKVYQEWTTQDDRLLWEHRNEELASLASKLGRGLRGTEQRLASLQNVDSAAYLRLFGSNNKDQSDVSTSMEPKKKLVPAAEVLRRIRWDESLSMHDFSILHYDRVEETILESPMNAPNNSIAGKQTLFLDALPEHRIVGIKYRERTVWDRDERMDCVFSNEGITKVIETYEEWKEKEEQERQIAKDRKLRVTDRIKKILGLERYDALRQQSKGLQTKLMDPSISKKLEGEKYVKSVLNVFRAMRNDPSKSITPELIPMNDVDALEMLSELVALLSDESIRSVLLKEIQIYMDRALGKKTRVPKNRPLPELNEKELEETFVRGSGPGGQKIK